MPRRKKKGQNIQNNQVNPTENSDKKTDVTACDKEEDNLIGNAGSTCVLKSSPLVGRFVVAKRRLKEGEVILGADPLVVGPCQDTKTVCIGCCTLLNLDIKDAHRCGGCGWPVCGGGCPGLRGARPTSRGGHVKAECDMLKIFTGPLTNECYNMVTPLRCLLIRQEDPAIWNKITSMESHDEIRRKHSDIWTKNQKTVVEPLKKINEEYSEELIHSICGFLEVNCFSVGVEEIEARALYPTAFLLQHDCTPNTTHIDYDDFNMIIRASVNIEKATPITLSYTNSLYTTQRRRRELKESKFFDCCCSRCSSSTELGTYMSSVKCNHCAQGWLLPETPLDLSSQWKCNSCQQSTHYSLPNNINERSSLDFESLKNAKIEDYENLLMKYENYLHPFNSTMIRAKFALSQLYGKTEGFLLGNMPRTVLERKYDICNDLMKVFDIVEPGMSRVRGVTLYECHAPLLMLTQISIGSSLITNNEVKKNLRKVKDMLSKSVAILSLEPPNSTEGRLYEVAKLGLAQTESWGV